MPRRKNAFLSDGSDSEETHTEGSEGGYNSQEDEDSRAERALFEHNGRKRRKKGFRGGKEFAWEGIFGADEEETKYTSRGLGSKRSDRAEGAGFMKGDRTK